MTRVRELRARERVILRAVVNHYLASGEPVGSRTLSKLEDCPWSPATIRNVLADLAELGYLEQPHTSAGRLPSDRGFRFFVEQCLTRAEDLDPDPIRNELGEEDPQLEALFSRTPRVLASMSRHLGVLLAPHFGHVRLRSINFIPLGNRRILAVLVARSGNILNRVVRSPSTVRWDDLHRFSDFLSTEFRGLTLWQARDRLRRITRGGSLVAGALAMSDTILSIVDSPGERLHLEGVPDDPVERGILSGIGAMPSTRGKLLSLLTRCIDGNTTKVFIGSEDPFTEENTCSLVATSYYMGEDGHGVVGVIGRKTMAYDRVIPLVRSVANHLNRQLAPAKEDLYHE